MTSADVDSVGVWHAMKLHASLLFLACVIAALPAEAFDTYSTNGEAAGNCADCHGAFNSGNYTSQLGTAWGVTLMSGHNAMLSSACNVCHSGTSRSPVFINRSTGVTGYATIGCMGCHGRSGDSTDPSGGYGAGLRRHHFNAGIAVCGDCHADADPGNGYTPVAENVRPPYYFTPDTTHPNKPTDPCDANGLESRLGSTGLDNDGNGLYDAADPACQAVAATATPTATGIPIPPTATRTVAATATRPPATATRTSAPANTPIPLTATATQPAATATSTRPAATPTATRPSATATPTAASSGAALYATNCRSCHGDPTTAGPGPGGIIKVAGARICSISAAINGTSAGRRRVGGIPSMEFLKGKLSDQQLQAMSTFLNSFTVSGQQRYTTDCARCHGLDASGGQVHKDVRGDDAHEIAEAIADKRAMRFLSCLPGSDIKAISAYINTLGGEKDD